MCLDRERQGRYPLVVMQERKRGDLQTAGKGRLMRKVTERWLALELETKISSRAAEGGKKVPRAKLFPRE